jgi:RNA polymerase sigma-70 factor (ECF subfamily)
VADLELAQACVRGDRKAQRAFFAKYRNLVHATIFRLLGSNLGIDDVVQDAFVEVYRSLKSYRGEASLSTWIHVCTVRATYAHLRRSRRPPLELVSPDPPALDDVTHAREGTRRLYRLLEQMSPAARTALVLSVIENHSMKEIAEMMGATVVATKVRVWRARRELETLAKSDPVLASFLSPKEAS